MRAPKAPCEEVHSAMRPSVDVGTRPASSCNCGCYSVRVQGCWRNGGGAYAFGWICQITSFPVHVSFAFAS